MFRSMWQAIHLQSSSAGYTLLIYAYNFLFFVIPIPNSRSLGLETVNYYVYGYDFLVTPAIVSEDGMRKEE